MPGQTGQRVGRNFRDTRYPDLDPDTHFISRPSMPFMCRLFRANMIIDMMIGTGMGHEAG